MDRELPKTLNSKMAIDARILKRTDDTLATQHEKNELLKSHQETLMFTSNTNSSNLVLKDYMTIMLKRALRESRRANRLQHSPKVRNSPAPLNAVKYLFFHSENKFCAVPTPYFTEIASLVMVGTRYVSFKTTIGVYPFILAKR